MQNKTTGISGEERAAEFLHQLDYKILERNFRYKRGEIDIISQSNLDDLVFVEVKSRKNSHYGSPESFVSENQKKQIRLVAEEYIRKIDWQGDIRFDIIAIDLQLQEVRHFMDAF